MSTTVDHAQPAESGGEPTGADAAPALDNPVWGALTGPHARFAEARGRAARYRSDVSLFAGLADPADPAAWDDLAQLLGPGGTALVTGSPVIPEGWEVVEGGEGVQMVDTALRAEHAPEAVRLGAADVDDVMDLISRTRPGPFLPRTLELGTYLGIRENGRLIAMAGERIQPPGWTEISAVCTDPDHRGRGLATRLMSAVAAGIKERGDTPVLHAAASNTNAVRLYESIGFSHRRRTLFLLVRAPGGLA
ncbi:GNAT family N-acetyltransferase [Actinacidiphila glaucinigra]|uniref:GNAT family N-acetyltransferase n=1 Tax=Actinacidiphila glaucinigra TaxID=235986 RepID=UPI002DDA6EFB|nr:GNAT family N-acetyltransferase [Actinacidiphila glaucinigra]WSD64271.1 GNAT family N-acetyltransferase [Actinacidiphila glaucinigra]